jgi:hypothetical protein
MYIPNKFNYVPISRETIDGVRKYATPDGEKLPSVTTILGATSPPEKMQALNEWRKRMGAAKAQEITTEASGRGTRMHKYLEDFIMTGVLAAPGSNPYSIQANAMADSIIRQGLVNCSEYWGTEIPVYYPKVYAGTTDLAGVHSGSEAIMDHKQTNKPKKREWIEDYFIQLLFYGVAHNEVHGTKIRKGVIFMCTADFVYQEFIVEGNEWDRYETIMWKRLEQYYKQMI